MPATSRSGERLNRRSLMLRLGSPSKSRMTKSLPGVEHLPQVVVAVDPDADHGELALE